MKTVVLIALILAASAAAEDLTTYHGFKVFRIVPQTESDLETLQLFEDGETFDFWSKPGVVGKAVDVMVAPGGQKVLGVILTNNGIKYSVIIDDVETVFADERRRQALRLKVKAGSITFTEYHRYDVIQDYVKEVAENNPDIVSIEDFGTSTEGRTMTLMKISTGGENKPSILVEGGIHAREWISPAVVLYTIEQLVNNENNRHMIETIDWYFIIVLNPDGYEYTFTNTRLWRKTRSRGTTCYGVDGNRNFDYQWMVAGASANECSETYAGPIAASEPETVAFKNVVAKYGDNMKLHIAMHSYGQYILHPWGFTSAYPEDVQDMHDLAVKVDAAIASVNGTRYTIGSSHNVLYASSGSSRDWAKGVAGIKYSYTVELPGGGSAGFDLPASRILPVCLETWEGMIAFHDHIADEFVRKI